MALLTKCPKIASVSLCLMGALSQERALLRPVRSEWQQREGRGEQCRMSGIAGEGSKGRINEYDPGRGKMEAGEEKELGCM